MDLNYLFHRQQVEHSLSQSAKCAAARTAHAQLAALYEESIARLTQGRVRFGMSHSVIVFAAAA